MLRRRLPPVTRVALAFAVGAAIPQYGVSVSGWALLAGAALLLLIRPFHRPDLRLRSAGPTSDLALLVATLAVGALHGGVAATRQMNDCRWSRPTGTLAFAADVVRSEGDGRIRVRPVAGCRGELRVRLRRPGAGEGAGGRVVPGWRIELEGEWRPGRRREAGVDPVWAGTVSASTVRIVEPAPGLAARLDRQREALAVRLRHRFTREAALVQALVVARRGELDEATRSAFVRAGAAHLLAISGFHVGLLAALVIWIAGRFTSRRGATAVGTGLAWGYVAVLGFPDAATRAAVLLTLVTAGRLLGRPVLASGALGTALLALTALDPGLAGRVGAQLSFAGALGLAVGAGPSGRWLTGTAARHRRRRLGSRSRGALEALAAATVATLATLPLVAWHFERVSLVSIPATLAATPLVALALPAVVVTLVLDVLPLPLSDAAAALVATGAEGLLGSARVVVSLFAAPAWASVAIARWHVVAAGVGAGLGGLLAVGQLRVGGAVRGAAVVLGAGAGVLIAPALGGGGNGALQLHVLDAGQGDALALRTPQGRWVVIDAGPPSGVRVAGALSRLGVRRVELLVLTHPDADHVGGLPALLDGFRVLRVAGPGTLRPEGPWRAALETARRRGVPWGVVARGDEWTLDGVVFRALHPGQEARRPVVADDPNARSVVLHVSWRGVDLLLTGDAPEEVEELIIGDVGHVEILKVGHHGSRTSTGDALVAGVSPDVALIAVGRGNRYGHPHPVVLHRLEAAGVEIWRTDRDGAVTVHIEGSGEWWVESQVARTSHGPENSDVGRPNAMR